MALFGQHWVVDLRAELKRQDRPKRECGSNNTHAESLETRNEQFEKEMAELRMQVQVQGDIIENLELQLERRFFLTDQLSGDVTHPQVSTRASRKGSQSASRKGSNRTT